MNVSGQHRSDLRCRPETSLVPAGDPFGTGRRPPWYRPEAPAAATRHKKSSENIAAEIYTKNRFTLFSALRRVLAAVIPFVPLADHAAFLPDVQAAADAVHGVLWALWDRKIYLSFSSGSWVPI
jgi:hypothetical protein